MNDKSPRKIRIYHLAGAVLSLVMIGGFASNLYGFFIEQLPPTAHTPTWSTFMDGKVSNEIARAMEKTPLPSKAAQLERGLSWLAVRDLGPRVRQGCPGWLFVADELTPHAKAALHADARAAVVADINERLLARNIQLFVMVVPDKSRIEAEQLCGLSRSEQFEGRVRTWVASLQERGIRILDTEPALRASGTNAFLRTDTHWSQAGAERAAHAAAAAILKMPNADGLLQPRQQYTITRDAISLVQGDLIRLAGIDWLPPSLLPPLDEVRKTSFTPVQNTAGNGEDDLFGDADLPGVALIGTSFSRNSHFLPFLQTALQTKIGDFARDGGDFSGAARAYFNSVAFKETPPRLLIWEIPERVLQQPLGDDETITALLPPLQHMAR